MEERFTYDAAFKRKVILCAEKIGNPAAGRKYAVSEACVRHWRSIKTNLFSCLTNRKSFSGPGKGRNPETDASVLEYLKDLHIYKNTDLVIIPTGMTREDSEQSDQGASSSENESVTERSLDELSD
jgi:hypothetical protein